MSKEAKASKSGKPFWVFQGADGKRYVSFDAKVGATITVGPDFACTVEPKNDPTYPNDGGTIKQAVIDPAAGVQPPTPAAPTPSLVQAVQTAGARVVAYSEDSHDKVWANICFQEAGADVRAGVAPASITELYYNTMASGLGGKYAPDPVKTHSDEPTPQQWDEYNSLVKGYTLEASASLEEAIQKSHGCDSRHLNGKQLASVITNLICQKKASK
jgi:hypothetical protein